MRGSGTKRRRGELGDATSAPPARRRRPAGAGGRLRPRVTAKPRAKPPAPRAAPEIPEAATPTPAAPPASTPVTGATGTRLRRLRLGGAVLAGLLAVVALAGGLWYWRARTPAPAFRTMKVERADITQRVTATGILQPVVTSPVGAQVSGIVSKLYADYNAQVTAGQLLVELDPALFQNAVALAGAQLAQALAAQGSTQATELGARSVRDRTLTLERRALVSPADLDASEAVLGQTAGAARSSAAQIGQARAQLARAQLDLQHSIIRSPVDGTVISRSIDVGQAVAATLTAPTLFTIASDLRHMQVHAAVDEADIGDVKAGQDATFTVDAFRDQVFHATVKEVRNAPQTAQNVVTYDVVLDAENPQIRLRPGMTANVLILIVHKTQVVAVPNEALRFRPKAATPPTGGGARVGGAEGAAEDAVYVAQEGLAVRVPVVTGVTDGHLTEVSGLEPGREVIVDAARDRSKAPPAAGGGGRDH